MKGLVQLCRHIVVAVVVLQGIALAQPLSLAQLRDQILMHSALSGRFLQCTTHGSARISRSGSFVFKPDKQIELNFDEPNHYSIVFFRDGTQVKTVNGITQKVPRHSPLGSLMFSVMSMQESSLDNRFEVVLRGTIDQFGISLIPKKRMSKIIQSMEITGTDGLVNTLQMIGRGNRVVSIYLFLEEQPVGVVCG